MTIVFFSLFAILLFLIPAKGRVALFPYILFSTVLPLSWAPNIKGVSLAAIYLSIMVTMRLGDTLRTFRREHLFLSPIFLLAIYSIYPTLLHDEIDEWFNFCLLPLLILVFIQLYYPTRDDIHKLFTACFFVLLSFAVILQLAGMFGDQAPADFFGFDATDDELMSSGIWSVGSKNFDYLIFKFRNGHNMVSALLGLGAVIAFGKAMLETRRRQAFFFGTIGFLGLFLVFYSTSRAIFAGLLVAVLWLYIVSHQFNIQRILKFSLLYGTGMFIALYYTFQFFDITLFERYFELSDISGIANYTLRIAFFYISFVDSLTNIWGVGFNYYYLMMVDDAMLYSFIINGLGLPALILFVLIIVAVLSMCVSALRITAVKKDRMLIHMTAAIIIYLLISHFSVTYLFGWINFSAVCWVLLFGGYSMSKQLKTEEQQKAIHPEAPETT